MGSSSEDYLVNSSKQTNLCSCAGLDGACNGCVFLLSPGGPNSDTAPAFRREEASARRNRKIPQSPTGYKLELKLSSSDQLLKKKKKKKDTLVECIKYFTTVPLVAVCFSLCL